MAEVIRMPRMSDTMEEGNIISWLKEEGEKVEAGETLAEVETDKATMELDSYVDGVLLHIAVKEGPVPINGVIAVIGAEGEDWKAVLEAAGKGSSLQENATESAGSEAAPAEPQTEPAAITSKASTSEQRIKASPLARNMAEKEGIDLSALTGSGDHGRIVKKDIDAFLESGKSPAITTVSELKPEMPAVQPFVRPAADENYEELPLSQMRKIIARKLAESKFSSPHFYLTVEINMDRAIKVRKRINEESPVRISFNDLIVKAAAVALRQHPAINSSWLGDKIRINKDINIGVAVGIDEGLLVPVIRHADMRSLSQINTEVKALAAKAQKRKLQPEEMQGNTFTISNLGMFDIEEFTAIINPPDACILAVGSIMEKPIVKKGRIISGNTMKVTLSCDHRLVDGVTGSKFLQTLKAILEDPILLVV